MSKTISIKDRIIEFKRIPVSELQDNKGNWRVHPDMQKETIRGILKEVGITGAALVYYSERNSGKVTLIDGHLRREIGEDESPLFELPCLITDLNDEEADFLLALYDPVGDMATMDKGTMGNLIEQVDSSDWAVRELLQKLEKQTQESLTEEKKDKAEREGASSDELPEMEILPLENLSYIVVMFKNEMDWTAAKELLNLHRCKDPRMTGKTGMSRILDGGRIMTQFMKGAEKERS
jgi:hypothetical protein